MKTKMTKIKFPVEDAVILFYFYGKTDVGFSLDEKDKSLINKLKTALAIKIANKFFDKNTIKNAIKYMKENFCTLSTHKEDQPIKKIKKQNENDPIIEGTVTCVDEESAMVELYDIKKDEYYDAEMSLKRLKELKLKLHDRFFILKNGKYKKRKYTIFDSFDGC